MRDLPVLQLSINDVDLVHGNFERQILDLLAT